MQHDQKELDNLSANVIRDIEDRDDAVRLTKLIQRACRHYAEMQNDSADEFDAEIYKSQEDAKIRLEDRIAELEAAFSITHNHLTELQIAIVAKAHGLDPDDRRRFITNATLAAIAKKDADLL